MLKSTSNSASKFGAAEKLPLSSIINKKPVKRARLIEIPLQIPETMNGDVTNYAVFKVEEAGHYNVSTQVCLKCKKSCSANFIQYGVCDSAYSDFGKSFNSNVINANIDLDHVLSYNLSCIKYLDANTDYVCWLNFHSANNNSFTMLPEYCHVRLINI